MVCSGALAGRAVANLWCAKAKYLRLVGASWCVVVCSGQIVVCSDAIVVRCLEIVASRAQMLLYHREIAVYDDAIMLCNGVIMCSGEIPSLIENLLLVETRLFHSRTG